MFSGFTNGIGRLRRTGIVSLLLAGAVCPTPSENSPAVAAPKPDGWVKVKDKTGSCQMSVPGDWTLNAQAPGHVTTSEQTDSMIISGFKHPRKPMSEETQKTVGVGKMFENTAGRWFYAAKPIPGTGGKPTLLLYHVEVARDDGTCIAQILVHQNYPEEEIKRIAASVSVVKKREKPDKEEK